jgi:hypothetical protein
MSILMMQKNKIKSNPGSSYIPSSDGNAVCTPRACLVFDRVSRVGVCFFVCVCVCVCARGLVRGGGESDDKNYNEFLMCVAWRYQIKSEAIFHQIFSLPKVERAASLASRSRIPEVKKTFWCVPGREKRREP